MIKIYNGYNVPFYVVMLKHAGYRQVHTFAINRGEFYLPLDDKLIVHEKKDNDTPDLFHDNNLMERNIVGTQTESSLNRLWIMMLRNPEPVNYYTLKRFVNTSGRN